MEVRCFWVPTPVGRGWGAFHPAVLLLGQRQWGHTSHLERKDCEVASETWSCCLRGAPLKHRGQM